MEPQCKDRTAPQLHQEDLNCKYWVYTDIFTKWGTALRMLSALTKGIKLWRLRLRNSAAIGVGGQVGEPGRKAMEDLMTVAEKSVLSTNCITKFPRSEPIYLQYEQGHDTGCFITLNKLKYIQIYNIQQDRKLCCVPAQHSAYHGLVLLRYPDVVEKNKTRSIETRIAVFLKAA